MLNFKLGGGPEMQVNALVGVLYLGIQDGKEGLKVLRTPVQQLVKGSVHCKHSLPI